MTAIEIDNDIIIIDAGMHFSNEETPGVDYVIPNTTYLEEHKEKNTRINYNSWAFRSYWGCTARPFTHR